MDFDSMDISDELREKAKACKSPEEILALAKSEGYKLSEAELDEISGGYDSVWTNSKEKLECMNCGKKFDIDLDTCPHCGWDPGFFGPSEYE